MKLNVGFTQMKNTTFKAGLGKLIDKTFVFFRQA